MPRFYFDLNECGDVTLDEEGVELPDAAAATAHATFAAREIMSAEIKEGRLCLGCALYVREGERLLSIVWFKDTITIAGQDAARS